MRTLVLVFVVGVVLPVLPSHSFAQLVRPDTPDVAVDDAARKAAVQGLAQALRQRYVYPDIGERYAAALLKKLAAGGYRQATSTAFADAMNGDLQAVHKDKHLRVRYEPSIHARDPDAEPTEADRARFRKMVARQSFGVEKVERLPGNIGLIDLRGFHPVDLASPALASAMNLVAATDALIIDLRQNGGGDPETVAFLCSYLFSGDKPVHINDLYDRPKNETHQYWSVNVPGTRYVDKPVYLLTSSHTFSAAEEFSYDLQNLKRATLVGETTGGGAHPGDFLAVGGGFAAFVPSGRAISPVTKTNWEAVGVKPDVAAPAPQALQIAHLAALRALLQHEQDTDRRGMLERVIDKVEKGEPITPAHP